MAFQTILVPYDFSPPARRALAVAADLAAAGRGRLIVLHVVMPFYPPEVGFVWLPEAGLVDQMRRRLRTIAGRIVAQRDVPVECQVVVGSPFERILDAARRADSIVMSTVGRTGIPRLLLGSVAERVVRHSPVPVLTIRGRTASARRGRSARRGTRQRAARRR
jgi:nucleotide-binding universal stress UspA family protein